MIPQSFSDTNSVAWRSLVSPSLIFPTLTISPPFPSLIWIVSVVIKEFPINFSFSKLGVARILGHQCTVYMYLFHLHPMELEKGTRVLTLTSMSTPAERLTFNDARFLKFEILSFSHDALASRTKFLFFYSKIPRHLTLDVRHRCEERCTTWGI